MPDTQQNPLPELVSEARERLSQEARAQAEQLQSLEQGLQSLRERQQQLEHAIEQQLDLFAKVELPVPPAPVVVGPPLEKVLSAVRNLITATLPEQVLEVLTEEAAQMDVRAAVFEVRGKAAWGAAANGFGPQLAQKALRALAISLTKDNPFRQVYETGGHVDATVELLRRNRNILDRLKPDPGKPILLLPIRSAGSVSAIFYADPADGGDTLPVDALKILTEFAGAQLDRLMALSGGLVSEEVVEKEEEAPAEVESEGAAPPEPVEEAPQPEHVPEVTTAVEPAPAPVPEAATTMEAAPAPMEPAPAMEPQSEPAPESMTGVVEELTPPPVAPPVVEAPPVPEAAPPPTPVAGFDISKLSEEEQRGHKDAKRFAKLLVSEIDLYNKTKVADGRKNKDLYKRLKSDIDRSRQTFEKRFGKTVGKQYDYFHDELVRTLAGNDPSALGSDYPGPSA